MYRLVNVHLPCHVHEQHEHMLGSLPLFNVLLARYCLEACTDLHKRRTPSDRIFGCHISGFQ